MLSMIFFIVTLQSMTLFKMMDELVRNLKHLMYHSVTRGNVLDIYSGEFI